MAATILFKEVIQRSMHSLLKEHPHVVMMGQGITDPVRMFGTLGGLLEEFGSDRIMEFPICEEAMTGVAIGCALNGLYPIQTHIRMDFLLLAMNQLINHAAKYRYMYGGMFDMPLLVRCVIGRSWGQGPQHSQSLQSLLAHIPGITVLMPATANSLEDSYQYAIERFKGPVVSIEHRYLYDYSFKVEDRVEDTNPFRARIVEEGSDVTIVATSYMVQEALRAAHWAKTNAQLSCEIIDPHIVSHIDHDLIYQSVKKTRHLIVADTSYCAFGVAAEVCRGLLERDPLALKASPILLGMKPVPTPTSHSLENHFYPDSGSIVDAIYALTHGGKDHGRELPSEDFKRSQMQKFKGPF